MDQFHSPESLARVIRSINSQIGKWENLTYEEKRLVADSVLAVSDSYEHSLSESHEAATVIHISRKIDEWDAHIAQNEELKFLYDELKKKRGFSH